MLNSHHLNNLFEKLQMILLVQYLISFLLRKGFQLQRLVSEERNGQMKVIIPQLWEKQGFQILTP